MGSAFALLVLMCDKFGSVLYNQTQKGAHHGHHFLWYSYQGLPRPEARAPVHNRVGWNNVVRRISEHGEELALGGIA